MWCAPRSRRWATPRSPGRVIALPSGTRSSLWRCGSSWGSRTPPQLCSPCGFSRAARIRVHVVDGSAQQPEYEFEVVCLELELFCPSLVDKPYVVVYNKMDLPEASERWNIFRKKLQAQGIEPYCISAINRQGAQDVIHAAYKLLQKERQRMKETEEWSGQENLNHVADAIKKERRCSHE